MLCVPILQILNGWVLLLTIGLVACSASPEIIHQSNSQNSEKAWRAEPGYSTELPAETFPRPTKRLEEASRPNHFVDAPDRDLFRLVQELVPGVGDIARTVSNVKILPVGHTQTFWLIDFDASKAYQSEFTLQLVTPHANWYVESGLDIDYSGLALSASTFEEHIYPTLTDVFGKEWNPGIDNDHKLNILNAQLNGVAGYFSHTDEYPTAIRPKSNQREIIYINSQILPPGSIDYNLVISHELQHAIHWNADKSEDTWINEGLAELAASIVFGLTPSINEFLSGPPISLTNWPTSSNSSVNYYGAASLFMHFLTEHYGGRDNLKDLLSQPKDNIVGIDKYLELLGYEARFKDVFREWSAANVLDEHLDDKDTIKAYNDLEVKFLVSEIISGFGNKQLTTPQYSVRYTEIGPISEPSLLTFQGQATTRLLPVDVGPSGCWWSNSGDSIDSTLEHRIDLPPSSTAFLEYEVWFEIEEHWDYLYIEVSIDGGKNWKVIETSNTSSKNPFGNGFGPGYTGESHGWLTDTIDLTPFAGEDLWIRLQYVTDDAISAAGACFRNLSIQKTEISVNYQDWEPKGFVFTNNIVQQDFQVQLLTVGDEPQVRQISLDATNSGEWPVHTPRNNNRLIIAVGALAEKTREPASYTLGITPAK